jgi:hypothetical protein
MQTLMLSEVLASLNKHNIQYGLQTYSGGAMSVWIGETWQRKAQANLVCDDMKIVAGWFQENAAALFPQLFNTPRIRRRA